MTEVSRDPLLELAERIAVTAEDMGIELAVIGGMALAAHNYVRGTQDLDFASAVDPSTQLVALAQRLEALGLRTQLNLPDEEDPLGGLLRVWEADDEERDYPVEIVNFHSPLRPTRNPDRGAIEHASRISPGSSLRYADLAHLVALKLYAGDRQDLADVVALLARNPDADLASIRAVCDRYGKGTQLEGLIAEVGA